MQHALATRLRFGERTRPNSLQPCCHTSLEELAICLHKLLQCLRWTSGNTLSARIYTPWPPTPEKPFPALLRRGGGNAILIWLIMLCASIWWSSAELLATQRFHSEGPTGAVAQRRPASTLFCLADPPPLYVILSAKSDETEIFWDTRRMCLGEESTLPGSQAHAWRAHRCVCV